MKKFLSLFLVVTFFSLNITPLAHSATKAWEVTLDDPVSWNSITNYGTLLIGSNASLSSYNPESGEKLWIREDLKKLAPFDVKEVPDYPILMLNQDKGLGGSKSIVEAIKTSDGTTIWKTETMSGMPLGIYPVAGKPLALFFINETMNTEKNGIYVHCYNVETGELKWKTLFTDKPSDIPLHLADNASAFYARTDLSGYQDPVFEGNTAYVSFAGLHAIDLESGKILWQIDFKPAHKTYKKAYALPIIEGDTIYATGGGVIYAVKKSDGSILWQSDRVKSGLITQIVPTPEMLIARIGGNFYNQGAKTIVLDKPLIVLSLNKADGTVLWEYKSAAGGISNFVYLPNMNSVLFADAKSLIAIDTQSKGVVKEAFKLPLHFKRSIGVTDVTSTGVKALSGGIGGLLHAGAKMAVGKERQDPPIAVIPQANGTVIVRGQQHILAFDPATKETTWSVSFNSPGASTLGIALVAAVSVFSVAVSNAQYASGQSSMSSASDNIKAQFQRMDKYLDKRFSNTKNSESSAYILTNVTTDADSGIGLAAIDLSSGETADEIILDDKNPEYNVDEAGKMLYYFKGKKKITAFNLK